MRQALSAWTRALRGLEAAGLLDARPGEPQRAELRQRDEFVRVGREAEGDHAARLVERNAAWPRARAAWRRRRRARRRAPAPAFRPPRERCARRRRQTARRSPRAAAPAPTSTIGLHMRRPVGRERARAPRRRTDRARTTTAQSGGRAPDRSISAAKPSASRGAVRPEIELEMRAARRSARLRRPRAGSPDRTSSGRSRRRRSRRRRRPAGRRRRRRDRRAPGRWPRPRRDGRAGAMTRQGPSGPSGRGPSAGA